jgi:GNAT superfamily N-acetyltransferase
MASNPVCLFQVEELRVRRLSRRDLAHCRELGARCPDYLVLHYGAPDVEIVVGDLLEDLPPGKEAHDKFGLGFFDAEGRMVGGVDLIRDYPEPRTWYLGLMLLDPECRRRGLGAKLFARVGQWLHEQGAEALRLAVADHNGGGRRFWDRMGFTPVKQVTSRYGLRDNLMHVMQRPLPVETWGG